MIKLVLVLVVGVGGLIAPPCDSMSAEKETKKKKKKGRRTHHQSIIWKQGRGVVGCSCSTPAAALTPLAALTDMC